MVKCPSVSSWLMLIIAWMLLLSHYPALGDICQSHPAQKQSKDPGCSCKTANGRVIDLRKVKCQQKKRPCFLHVPVPGKTGKTGKPNYSYDPCVPITSIAGCQDSMICQTSVDGKNYTVGNKDTAQYAFNDSTSIYINYTGDGNRIGVVTLECSDKTEFVPGGESVPLHYAFTLKTPAACEHSKQKGGLSTGSILCILLFVFVIIYLVGGIIFLHFVRGAQGVEMVPNYEFWKEFPSLVKEGTLFVVNGCKSDRTYQEI